MTIRSRLLFHAAPRPVWWLVLLAAVCTQACRADLIVGNANPAEQTVFEQSAFGSVTFTVINTGHNPIVTTTYLERASPRFGPNDSGDITYDAVQTFVNRGESCVFASGERTLLVNMILASTQSCEVDVRFAILDHDPFDELNPVVDYADWAILLQVSAKDLFTGIRVNDEIGHAYVRVEDDPELPEPGTATLVSSGFLLVSLLYKRRKSRCP